MPGRSASPPRSWFASSFAASTTSRTRGSIVARARRAAKTVFGDERCGFPDSRSWCRPGLRGDDGFGVRAAEQLARDPRLPADVKVIETGIGGMSLVQELMEPYAMLILLDAFDRGEVPGTVFVLAPQVPDLAHLSAYERRDWFADTHYATPLRALALVAAVATLPPVVRIVGCQPASLDRFEIGLDPAVEAAVPTAVARTLELITGQSGPSGRLPRPDPA
jgi:hydrogenase maturation protease